MMFHMSRIGLLGCFGLLFWFGACRQHEGIWVNPLTGEINYNVIRQQVSAEEITFSFRVENTVYKAAGVIHAADSTQLLQRIAGRDTLSNMRLFNEIYATTIHRQPGQKRLYYAFFVDTGDGNIFYSDVHAVDFKAFQMESWDIAEDGTLGRRYYGQDPNSHDEVDFTYTMESSFEQPDQLVTKLNGETFPHIYIYAGGTHSQLALKLPDHIRAGTHMFTMEYQGEERFSQQIRVPVGHIRKVAQRETQWASPVFYVYKGTLYVASVVNPHGENIYFEYAGWNPQTNNWSVHTLDQGIWGNAIYGGNVGVELNGKIYFNPLLDGNSMPNPSGGWYSQAILPELDPDNYYWNDMTAFTVEVEETVSSNVGFSDIQRLGNELLFLIHKDRYWISIPAEEVGIYNPSSKQFSSKRIMGLGGGLEEVRLVSTGEQVYVLAYSDREASAHGPTTYRLRLYTLDRQTFQTSLIAETITKATGSRVIIANGRLCLFGSGMSGTPMPYGLLYDFDRKIWEEINPTYSSFGYALDNPRGFLGAINGKIYYAHGYTNSMEDGSILEWDIDYLRP